MHPDEMYTVRRGKIDDLLKKAREVAEVIQDADINHGGLIGTKTLRAANELRLELARWK